MANWPMAAVHSTPRRHLNPAFLCEIKQLQRVVVVGKLPRVLMIFRKLTRA